MRHPDLPYGSQCTVFVEPVYLPAIQWAVKRTGAIFVSNPASLLPASGKVHVTVAHDDSEGFGRICREIDRILHPVEIEKPKPETKLRRLIRRITH